MNKYTEMRKASEDLKVAWNHFNYAPTVYHTDLAIKEIKYCEDRIDYLRQRENLDIELPIKKKTIKDKIKEVIKSAKIYKKRNVQA